MAFMYARSNAAPCNGSSFARASFAPDCNDWLTALSVGVTPSFFASAAACAFTPVWSVIMRWAKARTGALCVRVFANFAKSMSMPLAVTATCATSGSDRSGAAAGAAAGF